MRPSLIWLMEQVCGSDWTTMNAYLGDGFSINLPLSIFFTLLFTIIANAIVYMIRLFVCTSNWRNGYDCGYADGVYTKACKLAKIKFNRDDNVIVCEVDKQELEKEKQEALKRQE